MSRRPSFSYRSRDDAVRFNAGLRRHVMWVQALVRLTMTLVLATLGCALYTPQAQAASYTLPGKLPPDCSAKGGSSGAYTCSKWSMARGDTLTVTGPLPATLTVSGNMDVADGTQINLKGNAADLNLTVTGSLKVGWNATVNAQVVADTVEDTSSGLATFGGTVRTTNGKVRIEGWLSSVGGNITADKADVSIGSGVAVNGSITATGGAVQVAGGVPASIAGSITAAKDIQIGQDVTVGGKVTSSGGRLTTGFQTRIDGAVSVQGGASLGQATTLADTLTVSSGDLSVGYAAVLRGAVTAVTGRITFSGASTVAACVRSGASQAIKLDYMDRVQAVCCGSSCGTSCVSNGSALPLPPSCSATPKATLHHLELRHASGIGLTCAADTVTVAACQDAACTTPYTGGIVGSLSSSQIATLWPATSAFTIPAGGSSTTVALQLPVAGSTALGVAASLPAAPNSTTCSFGSPSCTYTAQDAGLLTSVSDHVAGTVQTLSVRAVRKADNANVCVAALANVTRALTLRCSYVNPSTGTLPLQVASRALNAGNTAAGACDASGQLINLAFDAAGSASTTLSYADAGQVDLSLSLLGSAATGDLGLSLLGSSRFIAAPASLGFTGLPTTSIRAGSPFSASVRALNSAGAVMPNFGREAVPATVALTHLRSQPTGSGAQDGVFSGSLGAFAAGTASASTLSWSEVGRIDLLARHNNYLGSAFSVVGTASAVGPFVPHHFDLTATPACGAFSYAGQPFTVGITARNASGGLTRNYDGSTLTSPNFARATTLAPVGGAGVLSVADGGFTLGRFKAGSASLTQASVAFAQKLTAPQSALLRVTDSDGVSSAGYAEPSMPLRSGRLVLSNAFGDNRSALTVPLQLQYWSGRSWVPNSADTCTVLPATAVARGTPIDSRGAAASWTTAVAGIDLAGGVGTLRLSAPSPAGTGTVELALNLGSGSADASCLASHPGSVGAGLPWLRARHGSCAASFDRDPSARVTFGIYAPETRKAVFNRSID